MSAIVRRFSILNLMLAVAVMAAEFGLLRFISETTLDVALMILPLLNVMVLGLVQMGRDRGARSFWIGFEGVGLALILLVWSMIYLAPFTLAYPLQWLNDRQWLSEESPGQLAFSIGVVAAIYGLPQILAASAGGWFWGRYRVEIVRRACV